MRDVKYWVVFHHHPFLGVKEGRERRETSVEDLWLKVSIHPLFSVVKPSFLIILQYSINSVLKYQKTDMGRGTKILSLQLISTGQLSVLFTIHDQHQSDTGKQVTLNYKLFFS